MKDKFLKCARGDVKWSECKENNFTLYSKNNGGQE